MAECLKRHIKIAQRGQVYRLTGTGIDVLIRDLADVGDQDLVAYMPRKHISE